MPVISEPLPSVSGLSSQEAAERLARDGPNVLPTSRRAPLVVQFLRELVHFFAIMLWVAAVLAWFADLPQLSIAIAVVVLVNATFSFVQERRSDRAAERLDALLPKRVTLRRDGRPCEVDAADIVVGDVMLLTPGARICADGEVIVDRGLRVDVSTLTGESEAISVSRTERVHAGTFAVDGEADAVAIATGSATRLAEISTLTGSTRRPQRPLTKELNRVVRAISVISVAVGLSFMGISLLLGTSAAEAMVFAIGVTVALVPEGLLPTVTLSLAIGAQRMAHHHALVRHLDAVETLGSTTFICTDKTGTLTENRMAAVRLWTPTCAADVHGDGYGPDAEIEVRGEADRGILAALALAAARCGTGIAVERDGEWVAIGDPMEAALDACARRFGFDADLDRQARPELARFPFDSERKRMSVLVGNTDGTADVIVKGSIEGVLALAGEGLDGSAASCFEEAERMTEQGLRVIAVAHRRTSPGAPIPLDSGGAEQHLELLGVVGLLDPPRPHAFDAIARCRRAGIKVAMITGDHPHTALSIGRQVGLAVEGAPALSGDDLPLDLDELGALIDHDGVIISRATPEHKLRIAMALRARGHVVAMTGDGVNDGPALQASSIGIAMGRSGTDVAREAADVVLLDDDFATIVEAVAQGRATFLNVRRFLTYHLTDNVAELTPYVVWALSGGRIPLALAVMQILALDIGTDTTSATALGAEPPSAHVLDSPPVSGRLLNRTVAIRAFCILGPTEAFISMTAFILTFVVDGWRPGDPFPGGSTLLAASGAAFLTVVLGQKANAWACRSATRTPWRLGWFTNRLLVLTTIGEIVFAAVCLGVPPVADVLDQAAPTAVGASVAVLAIPAVWFVDAWWKRSRSRHPRQDRRVR